MYTDTEKKLLDNIYDIETQDGIHSHLINDFDIPEKKIIYRLLDLKLIRIRLSKIYLTQAGLLLGREVKKNKSYL